MNLKTERAMMRKWIMPLPIILIGLNVLVSGCGIFSSDPPEEWHQVDFANDTDQRISVVFMPVNHELVYSWDDSLVVEPKSEVTQLEFIGSEDQTVQEAVNRYVGFSISLYEGDSLVKVWNDPAGEFPDSINSPFNYNSWIILPVKDNPKNIVGAVTFTITNEDLN